MSDYILNFFSGLFNSTAADVIISIVFLIIGFLGLIKGADIFVDSASQIAAKLKVPLIVIGLTIVAFGTSAPEAAISITSAYQNNAGIAVGNVLGSNVMNILLILGISALICRLPVKKTTFMYEIPFVAFITAVLLLIGYIGGSVDRIDGVILAVLFVVFMAYLFRLSKSGDSSLADDVPEIDENASIPKMIIFVIIGIAMVVLGSDFTVSGATKIAEIAGLDDRIIGLTVVAFGTSLPELVTCIQAARKKKTDIAIGNIIGSNIFNILFVLGISALVSPSPIVFQDSFIVDAIVAIAAALILWLLCLNKNKSFGKVGGIIMLAVYAGYFAYLFLQPSLV
ncbi:MAG: calcium/sodium antiporter [Ruminococcaceae bacterium]|nr:calcium/sodium antiporter [Oscillospiraceae bacterium]